MKTLKVFIFLIFQFSQVLLATEVDNFTDRDIPLKDSRTSLNLKMQTSINKYIEQTNISFNCETSQRNTQEYFYERLNKEIGGYLWATFELEIDKDNEIEKRHFNRSQSIYKYLTVVDGFALYVAKLGSVLNIGGFLVGTDKIGHFIGIGKSYFNRMKNHQQTLKEVMEYGEKSERTYFGALATGVFSYSDLVSNYEGLVFWQSLFDDENPLVKCVVRLYYRCLG
jgi:hypothetical protein